MRDAHRANIKTLPDNKKSIIDRLSLIADKHNPQLNEKSKKLNSKRSKSAQINRHTKHSCARIHFRKNSGNDIETIFEHPSNNTANRTMSGNRTFTKQELSQILKEVKMKHSRQGSFDFVSGSSLLNVGRVKRHKTFSATVILNYSQKAESTCPTVISTSLPKSNRYLAIKLHREFCGAFDQLALSNPLSRK